MDKKVLYALTTKIFNTLKKLGIKPKIGVTTDIQRLPGANSFNTDFSTLTQARPESLKKLITVDADFLAKANPDELRQYYNNLEYVQATYPDVFPKAEVVTEAKTGLKTLVDDLNEKLKGKKSMETFDLKTGEVTPVKEPIMTAESKSRKLTKDEIADYEEAIGRDSEQWMFEGTVDEAEKALKKSKAEEAYYRGQYKAGKLDPAPGEQTEDRMKFLQKKIKEAQMTMDRRLITPDEVDELMGLEDIFLKNKTKTITKTLDEDALRKLAQKENINPEDLEKFLSGEYNQILRGPQRGLITRDKEGNIIIKDKYSSKYVDYERAAEEDMIRQKYGNIIDDNLLKQILIDDNPQRKAEVLASIDEAIKMQEKGIPYEEIINIMKNTTRTKQAKGGLIKNISYKSMFSDLDKTLNKGLGTMFKRKR